MGKGVFLSLSQSYLSAARNSFYFIGRVSLIFKPFVLVFAVLFSVLLVPIGIVFGLLIILDWIGWVTDRIRLALINLMDKQSWAIDSSFLSFLIRPLFLILIAPIFLLSVFIPKFSSNIAGNLDVNEVSDMVSGAGAFRRINAIIWRAANHLFVYVSRSPLVLKPVLAVVAIIYSIVLILVGLLFLLLIPLDWLSTLIEKIRYGVVHFVQAKQDQIQYGASSFLFIPILLIILSPVFLIMILIPKITTNFDVEI